MNGFTIYSEYFDLITLLPKNEQGELLLAICNYMFFDEEPKLNEAQLKIFRNLKRPLDKSKKRSLNSSKNETKQKQNENERKTKQKQNENENETHQDVNVIVNVNDDVNVNSNLEKIEYEEEKPLVTNDVDSLTEITKKVIEYLNKKTNSNFRPTTKTTQHKINARLNEGYNLDDFIAVIDKKYDEWVGTEFEVYLCPETLFGTKFEKYLNQKTSKKKSKSDKQLDILKGVYDGTIKIN